MLVKGGPGDDALHHRSWSTLIQIKVCDLFTTKSLPKALMTWCQLWNKLLVELEWKYTFYSLKCILKCHLQNGSHIVQGLLYRHRLILSSTWISNHLLSKVWDEVTHPFLFPNFNSFIAHIMVNIIIYPYSDMNKSMPGKKIYMSQCVKRLIPGLCLQEFSDEWRCSTKCKLRN